MLRMNDDKKTSSALTTTLSIAALAVSLFGNVIQYQSLQQKKVELQQAQAKIDAANEAETQRQNSKREQLNDYRSRMEQIDRELKIAEDDNRRAQVGMALGKPEDQQYAQNLLQDSIERHNKLMEEKQQLQEKIDALQGSSDNRPNGRVP